MIMSKYLVIVESPAKTRTLKKFLGKDFEILASYGHVRDLLPKEGSVDTEHDFAMKYEVLEKNSKHVEAIAKSLKKADSLYLATDPDREGEAISWHVYELMQERKLLKNKPVHRIVFYEITKSAIKYAIEHPREISMDLVNAQQARRALDYLVGFKLSPLLWRKIRRGLSAGRVQSPALRLIVEREQEIESFKVEEYWTIHALCHAQEQNFQARLLTYEGEKVSQFSFTNAEQSEKVVEQLQQIAKGQLTVKDVSKKQRKRQPAPPFITSTLQQDAVYKLGFTARRAMRIAQQLYEGINIGTESVGLITYMRTDSVNLSQDAIDELRDFIGQRYGKHFVPKTARAYKTRAKNAQEAHEAIRPTSVKRTPEQIKEYLSDEQFKLYQLIWQRSVACQMIPATINTVSIDLRANDLNIFRATGSTIADPGFMTVYQVSEEEHPKAEGASNEEGNWLPELQVGDKVKLNKIEPKQHFTEPPPRYSEATLVKILEEHGIGRPSTYATIIETLQQRNYAILDKKRFHPTDIGRIVNGFLTEYFQKYVDYDFTANLEDQLDAIARGEKLWKPVLSDFWEHFYSQLTTIDKSVQRQDVTTQLLDENCPKCAKQLSLRLGKRGRFIGCTGYPDCDYTAEANKTAAENEAEAAALQAEKELIGDRLCPECDSPLQIKSGRFGKFIGCSNYPKCKHIESLKKPISTGVSCPRCHEGEILKKNSRRGKLFFACNRYPKCDYALWNEPVPTPCPKCQFPLLTRKLGKKKGNLLICPEEACQYTVEEGLSE